jgi:hypothetical protein
VGNALFTGAIERVLAQGTGHIEDSLIIRPFPQHIPDPAERQRIWAAYRHRILGEAGVAVFLFGNKLADGNVVPADGMEREWEIARELGLVVIPVGATGSTARDLANRALADPDELLAPLSSDDRALVAKLNEDTADLSSLVKPVADLVHRLRQGH